MDTTRPPRPRANTALAPRKCHPAGKHRAAQQRPRPEPRAHPALQRLCPAVSEGRSGKGQMPRMRSRSLKDPPAGIPQSPPKPPVLKPWAWVTVLLSGQGTQGTEPRPPAELTPGGGMVKGMTAAAGGLGAEPRPSQRAQQRRLPRDARRQGGGPGRDQCCAGGDTRAKAQRQKPKGPAGGGGRGERRKVPGRGPAEPGAEAARARGALGLGWARPCSNHGDSPGGPSPQGRCGHWTGGAGAPGEGAAGAGLGPVPPGHVSCRGPSDTTRRRLQM